MAGHAHMVKVDFDVLAEATRRDLLAKQVELFNFSTDKWVLGFNGI